MKEWTENVKKVVDKHPSCVEVGECRPRHRGHKDTRHHCKGRVGIPHTWEWLRQPGDLEREHRYGWEYNRITEVPVCFGCGKVDFRFRHHCRLCGEPWTQLHHERMVAGHRITDIAPCARCGAPWHTAPTLAGVYRPSGSVRP